MVPYRAYILYEGDEYLMNRMLYVLENLINVSPIHIIRIDTCALDKERESTEKFVLSHKLSNRFHRFVCVPDEDVQVLRDDAFCKISSPFPVLTFGTRVYPIENLIPSQITEIIMEEYGEI